MTNLLDIFIASLLAGIGGHLVTKPVMLFLWNRFRRMDGGKDSLGDKGDIYDKVQLFSTVRGFVERMVYAGAWLLGKPEIIAVLLIIKVTPQLKQWGENKMVGRAQFNIWLTGSLLSFISAILIAQVYITLVTVLRT